MSETKPVCYSLFQEFAPFDSGWRSFPHDYLLYAASGSFQLELEQSQWLLPPDRAAWIRCGVPIRITARQAVTCCSVIFAPAFLTVPIPACQVFSVSALARELLMYVMRWGPDHVSTAYTQRHFQVLADICLELAQESDRFWLPRAKSPELGAALEYTLTHLAERPTFSEVAKAAAVSERTLARRFAHEVNMTWRQFVQRARLIRATQLLAEQQLTVLEVAFNSGFESVSAFNSAFRILMGETPTQFRRSLHPKR